MQQMTVADLQAEAGQLALENRFLQRQVMALEARVKELEPDEPVLDGGPIPPIPDSPDDNGRDRG